MPLDNGLMRCYDNIFIICRIIFQLIFLRRVFQFSVSSAIESKSTSTSASTLSRRGYTVPDSSTIQMPKDDSAAQHDHHTGSAAVKG
ncbi:hypothetical protein FH972_025692 [Carpinus fangiana]|uniref:Uncharacterized protein n=1 Tax=Carpinus fangiana TaxID=176857 RepID=A0A5N6L260_9ROSI|nr:hypothetical protein FH972_025692 [Carpinus fangiana]